MKTNLKFFRLINAIEPGSVKKINTMNAPFKQVIELLFVLTVLLCKIKLLS